jgi:hypothetical protein
MERSSYPPRPGFCAAPLWRCGVAWLDFRAPQRVFQLGVGGGMKGGCNVWRALRDVDGTTHRAWRHLEGRPLTEAELPRGIDKDVVRWVLGQRLLLVCRWRPEEPVLACSSLALPATAPPRRPFLMPLNISGMVWATESSTFFITPTHPPFLSTYGIRHFTHPSRPPPYSHPRAVELLARAGPANEKDVLMEH